MQNKGTLIQARTMKPADYRRFLKEVHNNEDYVKIKNGLYASLDMLANDMVDIDKIIPGGILCQYSAWHFYGMTTQVPGRRYGLNSRSSLWFPHQVQANRSFDK